MQKCVSMKGKKKFCSEIVNILIKEEEIIVEDEELGVYFVGLFLLKKQKGRVIEDEVFYLVEMVVLFDLFFEVVLLELEKVIFKGKKGKKVVVFVQKVDEECDYEEEFFFLKKVVQLGGIG